jgi:hypothetical protein
VLAAGAEAMKIRLRRNGTTFFIFRHFNLYVVKMAVKYLKD